mgnify:CR=1 FL=1
MNVLLAIFHYISNVKKLYIFAVYKNRCGFYIFCFLIEIIKKSRLEIPNIQFKPKEVINKCKFFNWIKAYPIWCDRREHWGVDGNRKSSDLNCSKYFPARCAFILPLHTHMAVYHSHKPILLGKWPLLQFCYKP